MGAALSLGCSSGGRGLLTSAGNGDTATVREVLAVRPELAAFTYFSNGQNVAHIAAAKGDRDMLEAVVDVLQAAAKIPFDTGSGDLGVKQQTLNAVSMGRHLKAVMNAKNSTGQTPLMLACQNGHVSCVNFILSNGADVFQVDKAQRRSAIHYAAASGQAGVLRALLNDSQLMHTEDGLQPLKLVRVHDMSGQCRYIDSRAENGVTALHLAAIFGEVACVHVLLAAGASMMVRTVDLDMLSTVSIPAGSTPLHLAAQKGQVAILQAMLQAHADALGNWAREDGRDRGGRRGWEQDGRIDLRSVANSLRQLPYHVAWQRGFRDAAQVLNPTIPIDVALENVRELDQGFGSQKLQTLAAYGLRKNLLSWLERHEAAVCKAQTDREQRLLREGEFLQRVIADQRRKEALKIHSLKSAEVSLEALNAQLVSPQDAGHTFAVPAGTAQPLGSVVPAPASDAKAADTSEVVKLAQQQKPRPKSALKQAQGQQSSSQHVQGPGKSFSQELLGEAASPAALSRPGSPLPHTPRTSRRRLQPSRPAPPPPPSRVPKASDKALALVSMPQQQPASPPPSSGGHSRGISFGEGQPADAAARDPFVSSPFASPFAQVSSADRGEEEGPSSRLSLKSHPSGVELADPPPASRAASAADIGPAPPSRKGSRTLLGALPSLSKSMKNLKREASAKINLQHAASIPGFDNNLDADDDCGICLEEPVDVAIDGCDHKLCCACALKLCQINKRPPLCPFCRTFIEGFHAALPPDLV